jgi:hypothetical protein
MTGKKKKHSKEKRLQPRYPAEIHVRYRVLNEQRGIETLAERRRKEKQALTKDISLDGCYVLTGDSLKPGGIIQLETEIPCRKGKWKAFAEVIWTNESGSGLKFVLMSEEDRNCLKTYLEKHFSK